MPNCEESLNTKIMKGVSPVKTKTITKWLLIPLIMLIIMLVVPFHVLAQSNGIPVKIGVLAKRGPKICIDMWEPTAQYLTSEIPGYSFEVVPLDFKEVCPAVEHGVVDFVLANSSFYVEMEVKYGTERFATLNNLRDGGVYNIFGGVIFCLGDRTDIQYITDLNGKNFMAVHETSFGGWHMAWREIKAEGIDPYRDFTSLQFGGTHDAVVYAVRDRKVDAGTIRTDTLERMAAEGKIDMATFHIIHQQEMEGFPYMHSTRLYPEWPFAKVKHTSDELAQKVAITLLSMPPDSPAAKAGKCAGWTTPLNYQRVHECVMELRLSPYTEFGKVTLADVIKNYLYWIIVIGLLLILMIAASLCVLYLNRRLRQSQSALEKELSKRKRVEEELTEHIKKLGKNRRAMTYMIDDLNKTSKELKKRTSELEQANIQLKELDQLKSMFIASMSHELRTPLNSIIGFTDIILEGMSGEINEDQRKQLTIVGSSANHLLALINDIIDVSKIESGKVELYIEEFDLSEIVQDVKDSFTVAADKKGLKMPLNIPEKLVIKSDERRVKQIIVNLVGNAVKFTDKGKIDINAEENDKMVEVSVRDTGIGMRQEDMDKLFGAFSQIPIGGRTEEGTGLGLYLSKKIADLLGGEIWAESNFGKGSKFIFTLPLKYKEV